MTEEEIFKAFNSIFSNRDKFRIALYVLKNASAGAEETAKALGKSRSVVSRSLNEMEKSGVLISDKSSRPVEYSITDTGKKILELLK